MTNPTKAAITLDEMPITDQYSELWGDSWIKLHRDTIEEAFQLLDAKQRGDDGWLPISSAPEGEKVLVFVNNRNEHFVSTGILFMGKWKPCKRSMSFSNQENITHWQPLPSAPKETI